MAKGPRGPRTTRRADTWRRRRRRRARIRPSLFCSSSIYAATYTRGRGAADPCPCALAHLRAVILPQWQCTMVGAVGTVCGRLRTGFHPAPGSGSGMLQVLRQSVHGRSYQNNARAGPTYDWRSAPRVWWAMVGRRRTTLPWASGVTVTPSAPAARPCACSSRQCQWQCHALYMSTRTQSRT